MKRKVLSIVAFVLSIAMVLSVAGCGGKTTTKKKVKQVVDDDSSMAITKAILEDGGFAYALVRSTDSSKELEKALKDARTKIRLNYKTSVKMSRDSIEYDPEVMEILVGATNRPESEAAMKIVEENRINNAEDFIVKVDGYKIVIAGLNDASTIKALNFFVDTFCQDEKTWELLNTEYSFLYMKELDTSNHTIGDESFGKYRIVAPAIISRVVTTEIDTLVSEFYTKSGFNLELVDDKTEATDLEILIGNTNRPESKVTGLGKNQYTIRVVGKKLVVNAENDAALAFAVKKILKTYLAAAEKKEPMTFGKNYNDTSVFKPTKDDYVLTWNDEFNGTSLDRSIWVNQAAPYTTVSCLGTECRALKSEGCYVANGCAVIPSNTFKYMEGGEEKTGFEHRQISTMKTVNFNYGICEFYCKLAIVPAANALWFSGGGCIEQSDVRYCSVEIDLLEDFGKPRWFAANIHRWFDSDAGGHTSLDGTKWGKAKVYTVAEDQPELTQDFHLFTYEWTPTTMNFAVDGRNFFEYSMETDLDGKGIDFFKTTVVYTLMSSTMGASTYSAKWIRGESPDYAELLVDHVRLYQRESDGGKVVVKPKT